MQEATHAKTAPSITPPADLTGETFTVQRVYGRLLHYRRMSLQRGRDYVWPSQRDLARDLRIDVATVKRALRRLEEIGVIKSTRTGRSNRYYFVDSSGGKLPDRMAQRGGKMRDQIAQNAPAPLLGFENKEEEKDSSNTAAAALFAPLEKQDAATALLGLEFPRSLIDEYIDMRGPASPRDDGGWDGAAESCGASWCRVI